MASKTKVMKQPEKLELPAANAKTVKNDSTANLGFEAKLWFAADKLRNKIDAAEYQHVDLGLIFLKHISVTFGEHRAKLLADEGDFAGANAEGPEIPSGARKTAAGSPSGKRGGIPQFGVPTKGNADLRPADPPGRLEDNDPISVIWDTLPRKWIARSLMSDFINGGEK